MSQTNEELAEQLKGMLGQTGMRVAIDSDSTPSEDENPLDTDFFRAVNAFRAARSGGSAEEIAAAEERLRQVVRSELTGEPCE